MKEVDILYNGDFLQIAGTDTKIFLHADKFMYLIHLVEGNSNNFKRRIEFKKRVNDSNKYLTFSYFTTPTICISGELIISDKNEINGDIRFQILKENSTSIIEGYYLTIKSDSYYLEYIKTTGLDITYLEDKSIIPLTTANIEIFLYSLLSKINNNRSVRNQVLIPNYIKINKLLQEEKNILDLIYTLTSKYPNLHNFLTHYEENFSRKRKLSLDLWF